MDRIEWKESVPIFRNSVILKQLGIAIGIPFGLLILLLILLPGNSTHKVYALGLIAALLIVTWIIVMAATRGKYDVEYVLDGGGARCRTQAKQAGTNRKLNRAAVLLGLVSGNPTAAGAGMLAQSRQDEFMRWGDVTKVKRDPRRYVIFLKGGWAANITLFCSAENYAAVERFVTQKTAALRQRP